MNKTKNIDDLRWIRAMTPDILPHYLVEQVRDRDYTVEDFFRFHQINCMTQTKEGIKLNHFSHLYVLANDENQVKGMLWFSVDPLSKDILIQTFSMDKEYWGRGQAVEKLSKHIKEIRRKGNLNKIYWVTNYPKHSMRYGFKPSKSILMEYNPEKEEQDGKNYDGGHKSRGECGPIDQSTAGLSRTGNGGLITDGTTDEHGTVQPDVSKVIC